MTHPSKLDEILDCANWNEVEFDYKQAINAYILEIIGGKYKGAYGIISIKQAIESLKYAENDGDRIEVYKALKSILAEIKAKLTPPTGEVE